MAVLRLETAGRVRAGEGTRAGAVGLGRADRSRPRLEDPTRREVRRVRPGWSHPLRLPRGSTARQGQLLEPGIDPLPGSDDPPEVVLSDQ